jgi:hypothetical protein
MDPATCALAALRLAPLQIAGWGHPVTTGLPTMDLFVSGELLEGQGAERHYREKLIRLPGTGVYTELAAIEPLPWQGPESSPDVVRFTLCHQPIKFDPLDDVILTRIAKAVGRCEFWIASPDRLAWTGPRSPGCLVINSQASSMQWISTSIAPASPATRQHGRPYIEAYQSLLQRARFCVSALLPDFCGK